MDYLTAQQVKDWAIRQPDDGYYCKYCLTRLTRLIQDDEGNYYCPNEMCLYEEVSKIEPDKE